MARDTGDWRDEFDKMLDRLSKSSQTPATMAGSAAYVHDTLKLAWASARTIFGKTVSPEIALAICDRIIGEQKARSKGRDCD
jgi:hypothetical protein